MQDKLPFEAEARIPMSLFAFQDHLLCPFANIIFTARNFQQAPVLTTKDPLRLPQYSYHLDVFMESNPNNPEL